LKIAPSEPASSRSRSTDGRGTKSDLLDDGLTTETGKAVGQRREDWPTSCDAPEAEQITRPHSSMITMTITADGSAPADVASGASDELCRVEKTGKPAARLIAGFAATGTNTTMSPRQPVSPATEEHDDQSSGNTDYRSAKEQAALNLTRRFT
jgi:hypothetical protein